MTPILWAMLGAVIGVTISAAVFIFSHPKVGTLILDLSREEKDIAQFVFNEMTLADMTKYKHGILEIKTNHIKTISKGTE